MSDGHEDQARLYLDAQLGVGGYSGLVEIGHFDESPLEGEGAVSLFAFEAAPGGGPVGTYHVVAGETEPNYYPSWGLSAEETYNLHIGTRFMLVLEVAQVAEQDAPADLESQAVSTLMRVAPGEPIREFRVVRVFQVEDQRHAVARCRIGPEDVYLVLGDLPVGIHRRVDLAPQVVYRMHLGQVIRMEEDEHT
jgi:hypothetical protein